MPANRICPVCGGNLEGRPGTVDFQYKGGPVRFCGMTCLRVFQQFPEIYSPQGVGDVPALTLEDSSA